MNGAPQPVVNSRMRVMVSPFGSTASPTFILSPGGWGTPPTPRPDGALAGRPPAAGAQRAVDFFHERVVVDLLGPRVLLDAVDLGAGHRVALLDVEPDRAILG